MGILTDNVSLIATTTPSDNTHTAIQVRALSPLAWRKTFDRKQLSLMHRPQASDSKQKRRWAVVSRPPLTTGGSWWKSPDRMSCRGAQGVAAGDGLRCG